MQPFIIFGINCVLFRPDIATGNGWKNDKEKKKTKGINTIVRKEYIASLQQAQVDRSQEQNYIKVVLHYICCTSS